MKSRRFLQVDVFSATPYFGNPLAVVLDGAGLDDAAMQRFARWTNLSETCFLLPPVAASADYRVRIFTPGGELPFAGHPTLGSCHSWLEAGGQPRATDFIVQECGVGLVRIRPEPPGTANRRLAFAAPPVKRSAPDPALLDQASASLGLRPRQILASQLLDNGPVWLALLLDSVDTVLHLTPDHLALAKSGVKVGVAALHAVAQPPALILRSNREARAFVSVPPQAPDFTPALEVRAFAAPIGVNEDPVTGSLNASLAQWLIAESRLPGRYLASQGVGIGRAGQVYLERDTQGQVWVGGETVSCIDGQVVL